MLALRSQQRCPEAVGERDILLLDAHSDLPWRHRLLDGGDLARLARPATATVVHRRPSTACRLGVSAVSERLHGQRRYSRACCCSRRTDSSTSSRASATTYPDHFSLGTSSPGVEASRSSGTIACLIGVEGGHVIGNELASLARLYERAPGT
jgi:membrane dipeptidase